MGGGGEFREEAVVGSEFGLVVAKASVGLGHAQRDLAALGRVGEAIQEGLATGDDLRAVAVEGEGFDGKRAQGSEPIGVGGLLVEAIEELDAFSAAKVGARGGVLVLKPPVDPLIVEEQREGPVEESRVRIEAGDVAVEGEIFGGELDRLIGAREEQRR